MRNGTQEELDAAREDATLLPMDAKFKTKKAKGNPSDFKYGKEVWRQNENNQFLDTPSYVKVVSETDFWFVDANDLEVIK